MEFQVQPPSLSKIDKRPLWLAFAHEVNWIESVSDRDLSLWPQDILASPVSSRGMPDNALCNILDTTCRGVSMRKQMIGLGDGRPHQDIA